MHMKNKKAQNNNIKYVLASMLSGAGIGQQKTRKLYIDNHQDLNEIKYNERCLQDTISSLERTRTKVIAEWEEDYPSQLEHLSDPPLLLFAKGEVDILKKPMITIVGTRKYTGYGQRVVEKLTDIAAEYDITLASGLAYGIDSIVHENCLQKGIRTLAVVAGGVDKGFPSRKRSLYKRICENGLVLAEFPPGHEVIKGMFPMRNRILAALSIYTIVIEAPQSSGALITASFANDIGREVYTIPGDIFRPTSAGCNDLVKMGAEPIVTINGFHDIFSVADEIRNSLLS